MRDYIDLEVVKLMIGEDISIKKAEILVLGITFKENCPDIRSTKSYGRNVIIYDSWANEDKDLHECKLKSTRNISLHKKFDAIVLTVSHDQSR